MEKGSAPSFREREETRCFYTEALLHTEAFTHKHFCTQTLSHRDVFHAHAHRRISTQTLLHANTLTHTDAFIHRHFYTHTLLHADAFLQTHTHFHTQTLLHTDAFACRWKEVNYACRCRVAQSTAKHLLSDFQTENTTHEFDMTKNHCRRDLQTEGWTHQQKTSLTKLGNTILHHLAMPCFILHHPGLPNWEHNSWVWHLGWASLSNTMML